jgi:lysozyme family protein
MQDNWIKCLETILHHEGGYVNHPKDPGGMTNLGVTKRVYEEWVGYSVSENTMQNLKKEDVAPIYKKNYWDRVKGDQLPEGLDLCVFDFGVNAGTGRAAKYLQTMIGTVADGGIGPNTLKKLDEYVKEHGLNETIKSYQVERQKYYESLSTFETFGRGWTRRVVETTKLALEMI